MAWQIGKTANGRVYPHDYELWFSESLYSCLYIKDNCFTNIHFHPRQCKLKKASFRGLYAMRNFFRWTGLDYKGGIKAEQATVSVKAMCIV